MNALFEYFDRTLFPQVVLRYVYGLTPPPPCIKTRNETTALMRNSSLISTSFCVTSATTFFRWNLCFYQAADPLRYFWRFFKGHSSFTVYVILSGIVENEVSDNGHSHSYLLYQYPSKYSTFLPNLV